MSVGGKHALYNATQVLFEKGDRVLIPAPYWVSYPAQVRLAGAEPVIIMSGIEQDFKITPRQLDDALDETIISLILCSPSNPTGAVYTEEELKGLGEVLSAYDHVSVFFDAMYDRLCYASDPSADFVATNPFLKDRVLTFNGFSKTYAMTGWRLGYAIGPKARDRCDEQVAVPVDLEPHVFRAVCSDRCAGTRRYGDRRDAPDVQGETGCDGRGGCELSTGSSARCHKERSTPSQTFGPISGRGLRTTSPWLPSSWKKHVLRSYQAQRSAHQGI